MFEVTDDMLFPPPAGTWIHIVRQDGREEHICGVYSDINVARANCHRHNFNDDEIISWVLDEPPLIYAPED